MDDICFWYFKSHTCPYEQCGKAHDFRSLSNVDQWILLKDCDFPTGEQLLKSKQADRHYMLPKPNGFSLFRCRGSAEADSLLQALCSDYSAVKLADYIAQTYGPAGDTSPYRSSVAQRTLTSPAMALSPATPLTTSVPPSVTSPPDRTLILQDPRYSGLSPQDLVQRQLASYEMQALHDLSKSFFDEPGGAHIIAEPSVSTSSCEPPAPRGESPARQDLPRKPSSLTAGVKNRCDDVVEFLVTHPHLCHNFTAGWETLGRLLALTPADFDPISLLQLYSRPSHQQDQILLTLSALWHQERDTPAVYLKRLLQDHVLYPQVCMYFLAGLCRRPHCEYVHPVGTEGWERLAQQWGTTYRDFDLPVLNYLAKKPADLQNAILYQLAAHDLTHIDNLSAYLSVLIFKTQKKKGRGKQEGSPTSPLTATAHPQELSPSRSSSPTDARRSPGLGAPRPPL